MNPRLFFATCLAATFLVACSQPTPSTTSVTNTNSQSNIIVTNAWSRPTIAMPAAVDGKAMSDTQMSGMTMNDMGPALYMLITNKGSAPDRLMGVTSAVAGDMTIHQTKDDNGMMMMLVLAIALQK